MSVLPLRSPISRSDIVRTTARRLLSRAGLLKPAFDAWRFLSGVRPGLLARNREARRSPQAGGLPVPPVSLIYSVTGTWHVEHFLTGGGLSAKGITDALGDIGRPIETFSDVLDWGCGCGRALRHFQGVVGPRFYGTDYNPAGVRWVKANLPFVTASPNHLAPPLPFEPESFDLVYSISVLTHLPVELQGAWMEELRRVLRHGGILIVTLCGAGMLSRLTEKERARFAAGEPVVVDSKYAGTNMCTAYHPDDCVAGPWSRGFRILDRRPHIPGPVYQDQWLMERL